MKRIGLAYAMELVAVVCFALTLTRYRYVAFTKGFGGDGPYHRELSWVYWLDFLGSGFLAGMIVVEGIGVWIGHLMRRSPISWSWGRVAVSSAPIVAVVLVASKLATFYGETELHNWAWVVWVFGPVFDDWWQTGRVIIAVLATAFILRRSAPTVVDSQELVCRTIALLFAAMSLGFDFVILPFFAPVPF